MWAGAVDQPRVTLTRSPA